jgi:hypothetical protein
MKNSDKKGLGNWHGNLIKNRGLTVFTADNEPDDTEAFCFYELGFSDAFDHIFKVTEEIKKATG